MEWIMSLAVGLGLSAACGFRVFVPLLGMSIANQSGHLTLSPGFEWIGSTSALVAFSVATLLEVAGYFIPWVDNLLDTIATPAAIVAGSIVTASQLGGMSPMLKWSLAIIAGGGLCGTVQFGTVATRALSSGSTAGLGNAAVALFEFFLSFIVTVGALVFPIVTALFALLIAVGLVWTIVRYSYINSRRRAVS